MKKHFKQTTLYLVSNFMSVDYKKFLSIKGTFSEAIRLRASAELWKKSWQDLRHPIGNKLHAAAARPFYHEHIF